MTPRGRGGDRGPGPGGQQERPVPAPGWSWPRGRGRGGRPQASASPGGPLSPIRGSARGPRVSFRRRRPLAILPGVPQPPLSPSAGRGKLRSGALQGPKGATRPHGSPLLSPEPLSFQILPPSPAPAQETESLSALGPSRTWRCHHLGQCVTGGGTGLTDAHARLQVSGTSCRDQRSWPARF